MTESLEVEQDERCLAEKWASIATFWWLPTVVLVSFLQWIK